MNTSERAYIGMVKQMACACCGAPSPSSAHHPREGQGLGQRAGHFTTIPLCWECHQGPKGLHGDRTLMRIYKVTEMSMLDQTIEKVVQRLGGIRG